jgi:hypothetical protein
MAPLAPDTDIASTEQPLTITGSDPGRIFEGLGALSAGGSTRLLVDYPETQKNEILDRLFCHPAVSSARCNSTLAHGAALQHLKVEIGGDTYSTDGSEPSFLRSREEFDALNSSGADSTTCHFSRGYEWWLLQEARNRNPNILLDALAWGFPGWINSASAETNQYKRFFDPVGPEQISEGVYYLVDFAKCAAANGTPLNAIGIWNEVGWLVEGGEWTLDWVNKARKFVVDLSTRLGSAGIPSIQIVVDDGYNWDAVTRFLNLDYCVMHWTGFDHDFCTSVGAASRHYAWNLVPSSTASAQTMGKPLWASETNPSSYAPEFENDHSLRGAWVAAKEEAHQTNKQYIDGRMTKNEFWSPVSAYYGELPFTDGGLIQAREPWSGHYATTTMMWTMAHTSQFALPNTWRYIDSASCYIGTASCTTESGNTGSYVTFRSTTQSSDVDFSIVIETRDAMVTQNQTFCPTAPLKMAGSVHVWLTNESNDFVQQPDIAMSGGCFTISLAKSSIYSVTTTTMPRKAPAVTPPVASAFEFPYKQDFESYMLGDRPRLFSDQEGVFEIGCGPPESKCLVQKTVDRPFQWQTVSQPYTQIGDPNWTNYKVRSGVNDPIGGDGKCVAIWGRIDWMDAAGGPNGVGLGEPGRYQLSLCNNGDGTIGWNLFSVGPHGVVEKWAFGWRDYQPGSNGWIMAELRMNGTTIEAYVDGTLVKQWTDDTHHLKGMAGIGDYWGGGKFDLFCVDSPTGTFCP